MNGNQAVTTKEKTEKKVSDAIKITEPSPKLPAGFKPYIPPAPPKVSEITDLEKDYKNTNFFARHYGNLKRYFTTGHYYHPQIVKAQEKRQQEKVAKLEFNLRKMASQGATEAEMLDYVKAEGFELPEPTDKEWVDGLLRVKRNVETMVNKGAPEEDILRYVNLEGYTQKEVRNLPNYFMYPDKDLSLNDKAWRNSYNFWSSRYHIPKEELIRAYTQEENFLMKKLRLLKIGGTGLWRLAYHGGQRYVYSVAGGIDEIIKGFIEESKRKKEEPETWRLIEASGRVGKKAWLEASKGFTYEVQPPDYKLKTFSKLMKEYYSNPEGFAAKYADDALKQIADEQFYARHPIMYGILMTIATAPADLAASIADFMLNPTTNLTFRTSFKYGLKALPANVQRFLFRERPATLASQIDDYYVTLNAKYTDTVDDLTRQYSRMASRYKNNPVKLRELKIAYDSLVRIKLTPIARIVNEMSHQQRVQQEIANVRKQTAMDRKNGYNYRQEMNAFADKAKQKQFTLKLQKKINRLNKKARKLTRRFLNLDVEQRTANVKIGEYLTDPKSKAGIEALKKGRPLRGSIYEQRAIPAGKNAAKAESLTRQILDIEDEVFRLNKMLEQVSSNNIKRLALEAASKAVHNDYLIHGGVTQKTYDNYFKPGWTRRFLGMGEGRTFMAQNSKTVAKGAQVVNEQIASGQYSSWQKSVIKGNRPLAGGSGNPPKIDIAKVRAITDTATATQIYTIDGELLELGKTATFSLAEAMLDAGTMLNYKAEILEGKTVKQARYEPIEYRQFVQNSEGYKGISDEEVKNMLYPQFKERAAALQNDIKEELDLFMYITSGARTYEEQKILRENNPDEAAKPGESSHNLRGDKPEDKVKAIDVAFMNDRWVQARWATKDTVLQSGIFLSPEEQETIKQLVKKHGFDYEEYATRGHLHLEPLWEPEALAPAVEATEELTKAPEKLFSFEEILNKEVSGVNINWEDYFEAKRTKALKPLEQEMKNAKKAYGMAKPKSKERQELKEKYQKLKDKYAALQNEIEKEIFDVSLEQREALINLLKKRGVKLEDEDMGELADGIFIDIYDSVGRVNNWNKTVREVINRNVTALAEQEPEAVKGFRGISQEEAEALAKEKAKPAPQEPAKKEPTAEKVKGKEIAVRQGKKVKPGKPTKTKVAKSIINLLPKDKDVLAYMAQQISAGDAGERISYEDYDYEEGAFVDKWIGIPSTFPDWFQNKGYSKKETLRIIDKVEKGQEITERQKKIFDDLLEGARDAFEEERKYYAEQEQRAKEAAKSEGVEGKEIEAAARAGEEKAQSDVDEQLSKGIDEEAAQEVEKFFEKKAKGTEAEQLQETSDLGPKDGQDYIGEGDKDYVNFGCGIPYNVGHLDVDLKEIVAKPFLSFHDWLLTFGKQKRIAPDLYNALYETFNFLTNRVNEAISNVNSMLAGRKLSYKERAELTFGIEEKSYKLPSHLQEVADEFMSVLQWIDKINKDKGIYEVSFLENKESELKDAIAHLEMQIRILQEEYDIDTDKSAAAKVIRRQKKIDTLSEELKQVQDLRYVTHKPVVEALINAKLERLDKKSRDRWVSSARRISYKYRHRKGITPLRVLYEQGLLKIDDIDGIKLMMRMLEEAYFRWSMKDLFDWGRDHEYILPAAKKDMPKYYEYLNPFKYGIIAAEYNSMKVHPMFAEGLEQIKKQMGLGSNPIKKVMSIVKLGQFYKPTIIWIYDLLQAAYGGALGFKTSYYMTKAAQEVHRFKAEGIMSSDYKEANRLNVFQRAYLPGIGSKSAQKMIEFASRQTEANMPWITKFIEGITGVPLTKENALTYSTVLPAAYRALHNATWTGDEIIRLSTFKAYKGMGYSAEEAAKLAADWHGSYADLSAQSKNVFSYVFFVYSFRFLMPRQLWRLIYESTTAVYETLKGSPPPKRDAIRLAKGLAFAILLPYLYHLYWTKYKGFKTDVPLWKYSKELDGYEVVAGFNNIVNMPIKWVARLLTYDPTKLDKPRLFQGVEAWAKWEIHPVYRIMLDIKNNQKSIGRGPVWEPTDAGPDKAKDMLDYAFKESFRLTLLAIPDAQEEEGYYLTPEEQKELINEELNAFDRVLTTIFGYRYIRKNKLYYYKWSLKRLEREYNKQKYFAKTPEQKKKLLLWRNKVLKLLKEKYEKERKGG